MAGVATIQIAQFGGDHVAGHDGGGDNGKRRERHAVGLADAEDGTLAGAVDQGARVVF